mmetsp:Transcript_11187/g.28256  ORF Transcript_11187/g.28256 Transcript_11187/m.28256 type:complete len:187 (+) Transcript_11187:180-740(+)
MFFSSIGGDRMEADASVDINHYVHPCRSRWSHAPEGPLPHKLVGRVDVVDWSAFLSELAPIGRELLGLAWTETLILLVSVSVLVVLIFREHTAIAAAVFCSLLVLGLLVNVLVVRLVRIRAERFCGRHRGELEARGLAISAHVERWDLIWTRAELWLELELVPIVRRSDSSCGARVPAHARGHGAA